jgi:Rrf2 family protein
MRYCLNQLETALSQSYIRFRMLRLSRKADYALISLAYLAEHRTHVVSAREIAGVCQLPLPLLMNILKALHQRGILRSVRGAAGGYQIAADLSVLSLLDLSHLLDRADGDDNGVGKLALHGPAQALQYRLVRFMRDVSVADLVMPGRRIDVPSERVGVKKDNGQPKVNKETVLCPST